MTFIIELEHLPVDELDRNDKKYCQRDLCQHVIKDTLAKLMDELMPEGHAYRILKNRCEIDDIGYGV